MPAPLSAVEALAAIASYAVPTAQRDRAYRITYAAWEKRGESAAREALAQLASSHELERELARHSF